jgi:predicted DsbA family dithiol-disulfide isomerase
VLVDCAAAVGLDGDAARALLDGPEYADAVRESQQAARRQGVTGVPCYVFDDRHAVTGAQPSDVFVEVLDTVAAETSTGD